MRKFLFPLFILVCLTVLLVSCNAQVEFEVSFIVDGEVYATVGTGGEETIKMPENPTKDGYTFDGWFWDNDIWLTPFTANSLLDAPLSSDMSVYAKWKANEPPIPPLQSTEMRSKELMLSEDKLIGSLSNATETFSFLNDIEVAEGATYVVARDIYFENVIQSKTVPLISGDNVYYILVTNGNAQKLYTAMIRRCPIYTVTFDSVGGSEIAAQSNEGMFFAEKPADPTKLGYTFTGWDYDFANPITENITVTAQYKVKEEMNLFYFTSSATTCEITGIKYISVTNITIPDYVTSIGDYALNDCDRLTSVTVGNGVTSIGVEAFSGCSSLTSVTIGNSVTSIGDYAFWGCNFLTSVTIGNSVTDIGHRAFEYCTNLTSVTIPNSVTSIGVEAFSGCSSLTSIIIPDCVTSIGNYAFSRCSNLTSIIVSSDNSTYKSIDDNLYSKDGKFLIQYAIGKTNTSFTIPNSVTSIEDEAFSGCSNLTSVTIPNSVTSIGDEAFRNCSNLTSVTIPNSVTRIGHSAFRRTDLISITIPDNVTSIGDYAFWGCNFLTSVTIPNSVTNIGDEAFQNCYILTSIEYRGTQAQWDEITKGTSWDSNTGNYTITCNYTGE